MNPGAIYAFLTAVGFKTNMLTMRFLQEKGATALDTYKVCRYALIPALIWSLIVIRRPDLDLILHTPELLMIFGTIIVLWNLQLYLRVQTINSTNSMVLLSTLFNIMVLPLFLVFGVLFNHDKPNLFSISAIIILMLALLIKPTPHKQNVRPHLSKPLPVIVLLLFLTACCDAVLQGFGREALQQLRPVVFLGAFSVPTLAVCWLISSFYTRRQTAHSVVMQQRQRLAIVLIPVTWFAASIAEAYSLAAIPIYVFMSITVVTFLMDTVSDIIHKRIHMGLQTTGFIVTVLIGISLSVMSV